MIAQALQGAQGAVTGTNSLFDQQQFSSPLQGGMQLAPLGPGVAAPAGQRVATSGKGAPRNPDSKWGLEAGFDSAINRFLKAAGGGITIYSGHRSVERQSELWQQALKKYGSPEKARKWVAPPGNSKHNHGMAADLKFASAKDRKWAHQNAKRFGLHFPLSNENWHIEPLGSRGHKHG